MPKTKAAMMIPRIFIVLLAAAAELVSDALSGSSGTACALAPLPPHGKSGEHDEQRQHELADCAHPIQLCSGHGDPTVILRFRANRDQALIGSKPVDGV